MTPPLPEDGRGDWAADARDRRARADGTLSAAAEALQAARAGVAGVRRRSARERQASARDRLDAAHDRRRAAADRSDAGYDELTGAYRRGVGELALAHEISRARRTGRALVPAMIDVDGLKAVNDPRTRRRRRPAEGRATRHRLDAPRLRHHRPLGR